MKNTSSHKYRNLLTPQRLSFVIAILVFSVIRAAAITVTNTNDSGAGSLRQAIANAASGDTINFNVTGTITLTSGQLVINKNLTIQGPGAGLLSISGNRTSRVFGIDAGVTAALDGLTIKDGMPFDDPEGFGGCGIRNRGVLTVSNSSIAGNGIFGADCYGAGIFNDTSATLNLSRSTISGNYANDLNGNSAGGGIANNGVMTITDSTVSENGSDYGAGILNAGTMTVTNSTISRNTVNFLGGGGSGIHNWGRLTITNSTIANNTYEFSVAAGIACESASSVSLRNTIVANNTGGDILCSGTFETASHNLIGDAASSGGIQNGVNGNIVGVNPMLGPLRDNGGATMTHALRLGSPAINAGDNCVLTENGCGFTHPALPTDQRGRSRNGAVDIGAFERQANEPSSATFFDFDGDGRADPAVFRPSEGNWYMLGSQAGFMGAQWGLATDNIIPADYDGDGKADLATFRDGVWWMLTSGGGYSAVRWGLPTDIPVPADYDGDGKTDIAVVRDGIWWILQSSGGYYAAQWGLPTDIPVPADYDGDGKADIAIVRDGVWWILKSTGGHSAVQWGVAADIPVPADYDGDGETDFAVYREGVWWVLQSSGGYSAIQWGLPTDIPVPADYDGNGKADLAIFRDGVWWILKSSGGHYATQWGLPTDRPAEAIGLK